eukprot:gb/GECG01002537.1/.p1 GENE.gb/GECG01002537.1/~~gb/GECG01002537.1/.p1  ORF type:complete len:311 (+),score=55.23 gb/GECG01002537.1/:1-933(+)
MSGETGTATNNNKRYVLQFGLARENVGLDQKQTKALTEDMRKAIFELVAAAWGVSPETYKSEIALPRKAWMVNAREDVSKNKDLEVMKESLPESKFNIVNFLNMHEFSTNCKRAGPVRDLLLSDRKALEQFLNRLWDASSECLLLNQLFESDSQKGLRASMPWAFFYCIQKFMEDRQEDDAACCQFAEQLFLVMHILVKEYLNGLVSLLCELDEHHFSDDRDDAYSIEIPEYIWSYAQPTEDSGNDSMKNATLQNLQALRKKKQAELQPSSSNNGNDPNQQLLHLLLRGLRQSSNDNTDASGDASPVDPR